MSDPQRPDPSASTPSAEEIFTAIYRRNGFRGGESMSGPGSDLTQTRKFVAALPALFAHCQVRTVLDLPCGDFHWMRTVDLTGITHVGADVVRELVEANQHFASESMSFRHLDLLIDPLPAVDLILCRDCLVHFSFEDVDRAVRAICASGSRLLLTTTFRGRATNLQARTGQWRPLNLEQSPFRWPPPIGLIIEGCTENDGAFADKSLGLWRIDELREHLKRRA